MSDDLNDGILINQDICDAIFTRHLLAYRDAQTQEWRKGEPHTYGVLYDGRQEFQRLRTEHQTGRLYLYGEASYRDVFGKQHTTYFRLHTPSGAATMQQFQYSYDGNRAD